MCAVADIPVKRSSAAIEIDPDGCRWTNTEPSGLLMATCAAMPIYGSTVIGRPAASSAEKDNSRSSRATSGRSPGDHTMRVPSANVKVVEGDDTAGPTDHESSGSPSADAAGDRSVSSTWLT